MSASISDYRLRYFERCEPDFDNPEHQQALLDGKQRFTCKHCEMYVWIGHSLLHYFVDSILYTSCPIHWCTEPDKGETNA